MRPGVSEKREIVRMVEESMLGVKSNLRELDVSRGTFYDSCGQSRRSQSNVTPADICHGRVAAILEQRERPRFATIIRP